MKVSLRWLAEYLPDLNRPVEEIVEDFGPRSFNAVILPAWTVGAVVAVPGGAYPSYAQGYYDRDNKFYQAWDEISRSRDGFLSWMKTKVCDGTSDYRNRFSTKAEEVA